MPEGTLFFALFLGIGLVVGFFIGFFYTESKNSAKNQVAKSALESELSILRERNNALESSNGALAEKLSESDSAKNQIQSVSAAQTATINLLKERINELEEGLKCSGESLAAAQQRITELETTRAELNTRLEEGKKLHEKMTAQIEQSHAALKESFNALAAQALKSNAEGFLKQTENRLEPVKSLLEKLSESLQAAQVERGREQGALREHIEHLQKAQLELQNETKNLVNALRRPEVRGNWGELQLRRVVELAGMLEHCDFTTQVSVTTQDNERLRPDMIAHLPGGQNIVVDAKTPLDAYLSALEATTTEARAELLIRHAKQLRQKVRQLSQKSYQDQFAHSPEFVILFLPGEAFFQAALEQDPSLIEDAVQERVIIATPTTLIALLKAVAYGWRQHSLEENALVIRNTAQDIYYSLCVFLGHMQKVGEQLGRTVKSYNDSVGSLERNVLPKARRLPELGIAAGDGTVPEQLQLDATPRQITAAELDSDKLI